MLCGVVAFDRAHEVVVINLIASRIAIASAVKLDQKWEKVLKALPFSGANKILHLAANITTVSIRVSIS